MASGESESSSSEAQSQREEGEGVAAVAPLVASTAPGAFPVSFDLRKARKCLLCNGSSTDQSPLEYTDDVFPEVHGRLPWRSYEKAKTKEGDTVRVPSGKLCLICFNVYRALGTWTNL